MEDTKNSAAEPIALGALCGAYGLRGWVRVLPFQDGDALLDSKNWFHLTRGGEPQPMAMESAKFHGKGIVAKLKGIDTPEAAAALKGAVGLLREDFPDLGENEVYWVDIIGAKVVNTKGEEIGTVRSITDNGAHDVLEVNGAKGKMILIPLVPEYVELVDMEKKEVTVDWSLDWD